MAKFIPGGRPRFKHQSAGLRKMINTKGVTALLFDPGLGKTATVIDYMCLLALKSPAQEARVLVVCPLVAVDTWVLQMEEWASPQVHWWAEALGGSLIERAEALAARGGATVRPRASKTVDGKPRRTRKPKPGEKPSALHWRRSMAFASSEPGVENWHGPEAVPNAKVVVEVLNIDSFVSRKTMGSKTMADVMLNAVRRFNPDIVVVDESHKIKSANGNASRLLGRIADHVQRRIILTGTVMPHSPLDVYGQWRFLNPTAFGNVTRGGQRKVATLGGFTDRYAVTGGFMGREITGFKNLDDMQNIMAENAIVARKEDALDLPPTTDVILDVHLSPAEAKAYKDFKDSMATKLSNGQMASSQSVLTQLLRLRQITSGHLKDDRGVTTIIGDSKVKVIDSLVHDTLIGENRVVVFALFTAEIAMLEKKLARAGTELLVISGKTPKIDRITMRKRFGSNEPTRMVMIAQIKTMSVAVNELVTASHAVFASLSQQRDDLVQGRDRLNRLGQTRPCTFWYALAPGTVDTVILKSHTERTSLEDAVLAHVQSRGD